MATLLSLPNETLLLLLQSCDTLSDLCAFASSCKQLRSVFTSNTHAICNRVGRRDIPAFEDAVITSRATRIAIEHFNKGQFPPAPFPLDSLPISAQRLSLQDVDSLADWAHFIACIEDICLHKTTWDRGWHGFINDSRSGDVVEDMKEERRTWQERFHRSMYRFFLIGAVLCREYQEPLVQGPNRPAGFLADWDQRVATLYSRPRGEALLTQAEMNYLLTFPVFNFEAYETHEPIYGAIADFFVHQTPRENEHEPSYLYPDNATPDNSLDRTHATAVYAAVLQCMFSTLTLWDYRRRSGVFTEKATKKHNGRPLQVVPLGSFYPEKISMPAYASDAHKTQLCKVPIPWVDEEGSSWTESSHRMRVILQLMQDFSGQPNVYEDDCPTPFPPLQIFQYIARRYLGMRIAEDSFQIEGDHAAHEQLVRHPGMAMVYMNHWPPEVPEMFDSVDGGGTYDAYFLDEDD